MQTNAMTTTTTTTSTFARRGASSSLYSSSSSSSNTKVVSLFFFRSFNSLFSLTFLFGLLCSFMCARVHTKRGCPYARACRISTRCFNTLFFLFSFFFCARDLVSVFNKNHPLTDRLNLISLCVEQEE